MALDVFEVLLLNIIMHKKLFLKSCQVMHALSQLGQLTHDEETSRYNFRLSALLVAWNFDYVSKGLRAFTINAPFAVTRIVVLCQCTAILDEQ